MPRKVVYVPACVTRIMGPSKSDYETGGWLGSRPRWGTARARSCAPSRGLPGRGRPLHLARARAQRRCTRSCCRCSARPATRSCTPRGCRPGGRLRPPRRRACPHACPTQPGRRVRVTRPAAPRPPPASRPQLLRHDVQQPRLQGRCRQEGRGAGGGAAQGQREWQVARGVRHLALPGPDQVGAERPRAALLAVRARGVYPPLPAGQAGVLQGGRRALAPPSRACAARSPCRGPGVRPPSPPRVLRAPRRCATTSRCTSPAPPRRWASRRAS